jgi:hypothetical protein
MGRVTISMCHKEKVTRIMPCANITITTEGYKLAKLANNECLPWYSYTVSPLTVTVSSHISPGL